MCERADRWIDGVPVWACRTDESGLPSDPEKEAAEEARFVEQVTAYANLSALRAGDAKPEQSRDDTRGFPEALHPKSEIKNESASTLPGPRPYADSLAAVIAKYQGESDAELGPTIIWSDGRTLVSLFDNSVD